MRFTSSLISSPALSESAASPTGGCQDPASADSPARTPVSSHRLCCLLIAVEELLACRASGRTFPGFVLAPRLSPCWRQAPADEALWGVSGPPLPKRFCLENISLPGSVTGHTELPRAATVTVPSVAFTHEHLPLGGPRGSLLAAWDHTRAPTGTPESQRPQRRDSPPAPRGGSPRPSPGRGCSGPAGLGSTRSRPAGGAGPGPPPALHLCQAAGFGPASEVPRPQPPEPPRRGAGSDCSDVP